MPRCDARNEKLGAKIRHGELEKVPALLIVGEKEQAAGTVSLRVRHGGEFKDQKIEELLRMMKSAVATALAGTPAARSRHLLEILRPRHARNQRTET